MRHIDNPVIEIGIPEMLLDGQLFLYSPEEVTYMESRDFFLSDRADMVLGNWSWEPWYKNSKPRLGRRI